MTLKSRLTAPCLMLALLGVGAQHAQAASNKDRSLTVMTRNKQQHIIAAATASLVNAAAISPCH
jgi:hypothetical protein